MVRLIIENNQSAEPFDEDMERLFEDVCQRALDEEECEFDAEISITLTDNAGIREINREQRNIDSATDVLSFPMLEFYGDEADAEFEYDGDTVMLGDIVISLERAREQSEEYNHSMRREVAFLTAHSMLHLLGYDHVDDPEGERIMIEKQNNILNSLGITRDN